MATRAVGFGARAAQVARISVQGILALERAFCKGIESGKAEFIVCDVGVDALPKTVPSRVRRYWAEALMGSKPRSVGLYRMDRMWIVTNDAGHRGASDAFFSTDDTDLGTFWRRAADAP